MNEASRVVVIKFLEESLPRVREVLWTVPYDSINLNAHEDYRLAEGERIVAACCISIWNGAVKVSLEDLINVLDPKRWSAFLNAMLAARGD